MDSITLRALRGSIEKWEKNLKQDNWRNVTTDVVSCPLCVMFLLNKRPGDNPCEGCPVFKKTGVSGCNTTPYTQVMMYKQTAEHDDTILDFERRAIQDEIDFLKSLLPGGQDE
jgi:hypothetical protein